VRWCGRSVGVQISSLPAPGWQERVRRIEALGYSTLFCPDHFGPQWDPVAMLAGAAAVTTQLRVGTLVHDVDYRHPVVFAKAAATLHLLSGGRHEFGIGAGWMETDYREAGLAYDPPRVRIERLDEAIQIIRSMWARERTSFEGKHYRISEIAQAAKLAPGERPRILIGGGGRKLLSLAGRHATSWHQSCPSRGQGHADQYATAPARVREKVAWVREAAERAGRSPDEIELNSLVFVVALADDPKGIRAALSKNTGMSEAEIADCPLFLTGPASEIRERLEKRRAETGISYVVIQGDDPGRLEQFAEGVAGPLSR
jgi:probable F420-dependent oxidoreductase